MMIFTVTLNPSLDRTLSVPQICLGQVNRARLLRVDLSGKGVNVSRALRALGVESEIVGFVGGRTGQALREGLAGDGFALHLVEVEDETRQNITLLDESCGEYTKINEPGAAVEPRHVEAMLALVGRMARAGDLWAFCGSLPPGAPLDLYAWLIGLVQERGGQALLDSSGAAFRAGVAARPFAIKPNEEEAAELLGISLEGEMACQKAVQQLCACGVDLVLLTRGAQGLILGVAGQMVAAAPPPAQARSPVGAGDAALAGLLWAIHASSAPDMSGLHLDELARRAVACGTAAAIQEGTGVGSRELVEALSGQVVVRRLGNGGIRE